MPMILLDQVRNYVMAELPVRNSYFELNENPNNPNVDNKFKLAPLGTMVQDISISPSKLYVKLYNNQDGKDYVLVSSGTDIGDIKTTRTISYQYFKNKLKDSKKLVIRCPYNGMVFNLKGDCLESDKDNNTLFTVERISKDEFSNYGELGKWEIVGQFIILKNHYISSSFNIVNENIEQGDRIRIGIGITNKMTVNDILEDGEINNKIIVGNFEDINNEIRVTSNNFKDDILYDGNLEYVNVQIEFKEI